MANIKVLTPQEIEVWYILPSIRKEFAKAMVEKGLSQKEAAKKLHVTEPAVSQYLKDKRATDVKLTTEIKQEIKKSVEKILKDESPHIMLSELQRILSFVKQKMILCDMHKKMDSTLPSDCNHCKKFW